MTPFYKSRNIEAYYFAQDHPDTNLLSSRFSPDPAAPQRGYFMWWWLNRHYRDVGSQRPYLQWWLGHYPRR